MYRDFGSEVPTEVARQCYLKRRYEPKVVLLQQSESGYQPETWYASLQTNLLSMGRKVRYALTGIPSRALDADERVTVDLVSAD